MLEPKEIFCIVGARPNYMKIAPIHAALRASRHFQPRLVHTGQHYDPDMNDTFFTDLGLPRPDANLEVGSATHAVQTAEVMKRIEPLLTNARNPAVLVVGDVNSSLACALVAAKRGLKVVHVEAGLRSFDRTMPEEINRVLTDQISDLLFTTERGAVENLVREGIVADKVHFVGNVMIDSLRANLDRAVPAAQTIASGGHAPPPAFALATLHRPSNVDDPAVLESLLLALRRIAERIPVVLPLHPRTRARIEASGLAPLLKPMLLTLGPVGYLPMIGLMSAARLVLTDSGGIQEETTALGVPCLTLRDNTERPITVEEGTNTLVGRDAERIVASAMDVVETGGKRGRIPEFWDGRAAERIIATMERLL